MQQEELVSIIMPSYNASKFLADSISCILNQTYKNLELLITDDASNDETTIQTLKKFAQKDKRVDVVFLKENHGPGFARNNSIQRAKGRYIAFCDSDDRWTNDKLEKQIAFMQEKNCALSCASYLICDESNQNIGINIPPHTITYNMEKRDNKVGCLTAIYDTQLLGKKFFMPTIRKRQDWALFLQIMKECKICYAYNKTPLAYYRIRKNSVSSNKSSLIKYNVAIYKEILGFSRAKSYFYFFALFMPTYAFKIFKRKMDSKKYRKNCNKSCCGCNIKPYRSFYNKIQVLRTSNKRTYCMTSNEIPAYVKMNTDVNSDRFIPDGMNELERNIKRIGDMLLAGVSLIVFSPLFGICYFLVKKEDGGPAIFKQERIGRFGRPFYIYKFRSMRVDAEKNGPQLFGHKADTRMTKIGVFLRDHHLDELPQLWNVFKGDMAFIGPRPERKFYIDQIMAHDKRYPFLYQIRPGVTSYATLYNGYTDTMEKMLRRLELDLYYLEHRSWWFDAKILIKTFCNIVFGKKF